MANPVRDAISLVAHALMRLQEAVDLQEQREERNQRELRQQVQDAERRMQEALQRQARDAVRQLHAALRLQEQRADAALRAAVRQMEEQLKLQEKDDPPRRSVARDQEAPPDANVIQEKETQAADSKTSDKGAALQSLEDRLEKVEISLKKAMDTFLPKVDTLLRQMGESPPPDTTSPSSVVTAIVAYEPSLTSPPSSYADEDDSHVQCVLGAIRAAQARALQATNSPSSAGEELCAAAADGRLESVRYLLDTGANVNYTNAEADTPLLRAVCNSVHPDVVSLLLERGADPNIVDCSGTTPLHVAAQNDETYLVQLIGSGADVNARDANGSTPLHWAASTGNEFTVRTLLQAGARKDLKAWKGWDVDKTPFDLVSDSQELRDMLCP